MKNIKGTSFIALLAVLFIAFIGCGDDGNDVRSHLNEHDFAQNPSLVATTDHVVIINLEHPDATDVHENDSHVIGIDRIPLYFPEDVIHEFVIEYKEEGDAYFEVLLDEEGNDILRLDRGNTTVTENITAGTYTLEINHGRGIDGAIILFVRPGSTFTGGDCPGCDLHDANLSGANLEWANLSHANLSLADLSHAKLSPANLTAANLTAANLNEADLQGTDMCRASMRAATFCHANMVGTLLGSADMRGVDLTGANMYGAYLGDADPTAEKLRGADLSGAILTGADLTGVMTDCAIWVDGTTCGFGSYFDGTKCVGGSTDRCL
jgi:hypothetical protein